MCIRDRQEFINAIPREVVDQTNEVVSGLVAGINNALMSATNKINAAFKTAIMGLTDMGYVAGIAEILSRGTDRATVKVPYEGKIFWIAIGYR